MHLVIQGLSIYIPGQSKPCIPSDTEWLRCYSSIPLSTPISLKETSLLSTLSPSHSIPQVKSHFNFQINLTQLYHIPEFILRSCDEAGWYAIACGLEALRDARIDIFSKEGYIEGLSKDLQDTGVISVGMFSSLLTQQQELESPSMTDKTLIHRLIIRPCSHLSQLIKSKGPSLHLDATCSSTQFAISLAEDWIRQKRCSRVLVIGSDIPSDSRLFPLVASAFSKVGVLTTSPSSNEACQPFSPSRSGFVLGSTALGMMLEAKQDAPIGQVELITTHIANAAYHPLALNEEQMILSLEKLVTQVTESCQITKEQLARSMVYMAHETSTKQCASSELCALRHVFGSSLSSIIICGLKGLAGHSLSTNYEEVILVDLLSRKQLPPIVNLNNHDPRLGNDLTFSDGSRHNRVYGLRFTAGFGSHIGYSLYKYNS